MNEYILLPPPPRRQPLLPILGCVKQYSNYGITMQCTSLQSFFACSQIKLCQFHFTTSVNMLLSVLLPKWWSLFPNILCCLWMLGSEKTESDPVCLCNSYAKIIPLGNARVGKVEKLSSCLPSLTIFNHPPLSLTISNLIHKVNHF